MVLTIARHSLPALLLLLGCPSTIGDPATTDSDGACPNPAFTCAPECSHGECGPLQPFDDQGCLRLPCATDEQCPADLRCYQPEAYGECDVANTIECEPLEAGCVCTVSTGPAGYCVDADDRPTKLADDCACGCECGDPESHSQRDRSPERAPPSASAGARTRAVCSA